MKNLIIALKLSLISASFSFSQSWTLSKISEQIPSIFVIKVVSGTVDRPFMLPVIDTLKYSSLLNGLIKNNQFYLNYLLNHCSTHKIDMEHVQDLSLEDANSLYHDMLTKDAKFIDCFTKAASYYLNAQGIAIDDWHVETKPTITNDELLKTCSEFFNRIDYKNGKVLWVLNDNKTPLFYKTKPRQSELVEAFCQQAIMYWTSKRKWNRLVYSSEFVEKVKSLNENMDVNNLSNQDKIVIVNSMRKLMISNANFKAAINEEYTNCKAWLGFVVVD